MSGDLHIGDAGEGVLMDPAGTSRVCPHRLMNHKCPHAAITAPGRSRLQSRRNWSTSSRLALPNSSSSEAQYWRRGLGLRPPQRISPALGLASTRWCRLDGSRSVGMVRACCSVARRWTPGLSEVALGVPNGTGGE